MSNREEWERFIERIKQSGAGEYGTDHFMCLKHEHWKMLWAQERIETLERQATGRVFSALLIGDKNGLLAEEDHNWDKHPECYERIRLIEYN